MKYQTLQCLNLVKVKVRAINALIKNKKIDKNHVNIQETRIYQNIPKEIKTMETIIIKPVFIPVKQRINREDQLTEMSL